MQTEKLMEALGMRNTPQIVFINKMTVTAKTSDLVRRAEEKLNIKVRLFELAHQHGLLKGVYNLDNTPNFSTYKLPFLKKE